MNIPKGETRQELLNRAFIYIIAISFAAIIFLRVRALLFDLFVAVVLAALAEGAIGDAYVALGEHSSALTHYKAALSVNTNDFSTPKFLYKAGVTALELGDRSGAASYFDQLKSNYVGTSEANLAEAYIGMLE